MRIRFLGAAQTVTGSCHCLEVGNTRVMVDCGMFQGSRVLRERNYQPFAVSPESVDYVLLTHAHIDHSGLIPKLFKHGFKGKVVTTAATIDLCSVMLPDSGYIQEMEVERLNRKAKRAGRPEMEPVYTADDARDCLRFFEPVNYNEIVSLNKELSVRFMDAGHILGSALLEVYALEGGQTTKLVFSGDLGSRGRPFLKDPSLLRRTDYVIMESTYGNRLHPEQGDTVEQLHQVVWEAYRKGGNLIIPAFAVERTQDLIYDLNQLVISKRFPPVKVFIDSPMAAAATEVFRKHSDCFDTETSCLINQGQDPLAMPGLHFAHTVEESIALNNIKSGAVIISASGMCDAGRIKHHLKHNLWRPECTVLFVGYQAPGTKGRQIKDGAKTVRIHGEEIAVRADIRSIDSYSAHADQRDLLEWLGYFRSPVKRVFLVHGEPESAGGLAEQISQRYALPVSVPALGETVQLTAGIPVSAEDISRVQAAVTAKLQELLKGGLGRGQYNQIMHQLNDLDGLLERINKQAG